MHNKYYSMMFAVGIALSVSGCAGMPAWADKYQQLANSGECEQAEELLVQNINSLSPGKRAFSYGHLNMTCYKNQKETVKWMTLAARYGQQEAAHMLTILDAPVPAPDLAGSNGSGEMSMAEAIALGIIAGSTNRGATQGHSLDTNTHTTCRVIAGTMRCDSY